MKLGDAESLRRPTAVKGKLVLLGVALLVE
jgi:hypothetical protein